MKKLLFILFMIIPSSFLYAETVAIQLEDGRSIYAERNIYEYKYDSNGNNIYRKDKDGEIWLDYDKNGNMIHFQRTSKEEKTLFSFLTGDFRELYVEYDSNGKMKMSLDDWNNVTFYNSNEIELLRCRASWPNTFCLYEPLGSTLFDFSVDDNSDKDVYDFIKYNSEGNIIYFKEGFGETFIDYDENGNMLHWREMFGENINKEYWYTYDSNNNLLEVRNNRDKIEEFKYDSDGHLIYHKDNDKTEIRRYDSNGFMIYKKDMDNNIEYWKYDSKGNLIYHTYNGTTYAFKYNEKNELIQKTGTDGSVSKYEYKYNKKGEMIRKIELSYRLKIARSYER